MSRAGILAAAGASLAPAVAPQARIYGAGPIERYLRQRGRSQRRGSFDSRYSANTGQPHENAKEIARRVRQAARDAERQAERVKSAGRSYNPEFSPVDVPLGLSRRGRLVPLK